MGEYSEFKARITAELDTTQLEKDVKNLDKKIKLKVDTGDGKENVNNVGTTIDKTTKKASGFGATIQHFKPIDYFGGQKSLEYTQRQCVGY